MGQRKGILNISMRVSDHKDFSGRILMVSSLHTPDLTLKKDFGAIRHFMMVLSFRNCKKHVDVNIRFQVTLNSSLLYSDALSVLKKK